MRMSRFQIETNTKCQDGLVDPAVIVCHDGEIETTIGILLILFPWLEDIMKDGMCCGKTLCSNVIIPDIKIGTTTPPSQKLQVSLNK